MCRYVPYINLDLSEIIYCVLVPGKTWNKVHLSAYLKYVLVYFNKSSYLNE